MQDVDGSAIEEATFLVRSPHRIEVLRAVREEPLTRSELADRTDVSRVTLGRSLGAMEERGWLTRVDGAYQIRPLGAFVCAATEEFLDAMATQTRLHDVADLLSLDELGFDLRRLSDASLVLATRHDTGAVIRRYLELVADAAELYVLKETVDLSVVTAVSDRIAAGELDVSVVYSAAAVETTCAVPEARELLCRDLSNGKRAFHHAESLPHHLAVVDETVVLFLLDDRGVQGLLETTDPMVREWAMETFRTVEADAERLDPDALPDTS